LRAGLLAEILAGAGPQNGRALEWIAPNLRAVILRTSQISERMRLGQGAEHPAFARRCCLHIQGEQRYENGLDRGCCGYRFGHWLSWCRGWMRPGLPQHFQRRVCRRRLGQCARPERMSCNVLSPTSVWRRICLAAAYARVLPGLTRSTKAIVGSYLSI
jgi:hypothetical protein